MNERSYRELNAVIDRWNATVGDRFDGYAAPYRDRSTFDGLLAFYGSLTDFVGAAPGTVGCDLGCWLGFPVYLEAVTSDSKVIGVEIQPEFTGIARDWAAHVDLDTIEFVAMDNGRVPLETGSVDWVLINQVLCNALPGSFDATIGEACRILADGGTLVVADSNAPQNEGVVERLLETYHQAEIGSGTADRPNGYNHRARRALLDELAGDLDESQLDELARTTCYLWRPELEAAIAHLVAGDRGFEPSPYVHSLDRTPCNPLNGAALGNPTDPHDIAQIVRDHGLRPVVTQALTHEAPDHEALAAGLAASGSFYVIARR